MSVNRPSSLLWCSTGARQECPIEISPEKMVIRYQSEGQNVTCGPTTSGSRNIEGEVSWQLQHGNRIGSAVLFVGLSKDWDLQPVCIATFRGIGTCHKPLNFTLYSRSLFSGLVHFTGDVFISSRSQSFFSTEMPDQVSITHVGSQSTVVENKQIQLQCNITGVAPAQHLTVSWFQGNKTLLTVGEGGQRDLSFRPATCAYACPTLVP